jgi:polyhydroxyalkanoate synthase
VIGRPADPPFPPDGKDRRFADPSWKDHPALFAVRQSYLAAARLVDDLRAVSGVDERTGSKAALAVRSIVDTLAPTKFLPTNPAALKRALDTGGRSLLAGGRNFLVDLVANRGRPARSTPARSSSARISRVCDRFVGPRG